MITGDNIFTSIHVGLETHLIQPHEMVWVGQYDLIQKKIQWILYENVQVKTNAMDSKSSLKSEDSHYQSKLIKSKILHHS